MAWVSASRPWPCSRQQWNLAAPSRVTPEQPISEVSEMALVSSPAMAVIILKVAPGGYWPRVHFLTRRGAGRELGPRGGAPPAGEGLRVVARHGGQRQDAAGRDVEHHGTGRELGGQA